MNERLDDQLFKAEMQNARLQDFLTSAMIECNKLDNTEKLNNLLVEMWDLTLDTQSEL